MSAIAHQPPSRIAPKGDCCERPNDSINPKTRFYIDIIKKVTRVAVLLIGAYFLPLYTAIGFSVGLISGALAQLVSEKQLEKGDLLQLCLMGYMQFASDSKWNEFVITALTAASFVDCIWRGSPFFTAMVCGGVGFWVGKSGAWQYVQHQKSATPKLS